MFFGVRLFFSLVLWLLKLWVDIYTFYLHLCLFFYLCFCRRVTLLVYVFNHFYYSYYFFVYAFALFLLNQFVYLSVNYFIYSFNLVGLATSLFVVIQVSKVIHLFKWNYLVYYCLHKFLLSTYQILILKDKLVYWLVWQQTN